MPNHNSNKIDCKAGTRSKKKGMYLLVNISTNHAIRFIYGNNLFPRSVKDWNTMPIEVTQIGANGW